LFGQIEQEVRRVGFLQRSDPRWLFEGKAVNDLLEETPSKNVGRIRVLNGLSGSDQAIVSRQGVLLGK
jgi:hypothetical protein